ncbi:MAG TPA: histidine kinase dimerization/phospho-acceptor domain-containing protein, partial [Gemmataceae bacterium]|nr:histidine kinase dimerization/phospho-acceptor domain-containing protein [Gemmataceae bacterium]
MTLTARLLLFSLATLGLVLAGFSAGLWLLARDDLRRQADERLEAAANTLVAACEVGPEGVEWEPRERSLAVGAGPVGEPIAWLVADDRGNPVGRSDGPASDDLSADAATRPRDLLGWRGDRWQVRRRWLVAPQAAGPLPPPHPGETRYPAVAVVVGVPTGPAAAALGRLAAALAGLSAAVWVVALVAGRAVCRWALRPLTAMADAARAMPADDPGGRLPVGPAADELADLGRAFNGLLDRLGESHERQRRFAGEASHQLRTPLTALLGQVDVALRRDRPPGEYRRVLESVRGQADRMRKLVEALLFLTRADAEAGLPGREPIDLAAWLPDHLRTWSGHPRAADLTHDPAGGPLWVEAHPVLLGELLDNLIDNALKFSLPETPVIVRAGGASTG